MYSLIVLIRNFVNIELQINVCFKPKVREIRRAVLLNRAADDVDSDTEWENPEEGSQATGPVGTPRPGNLT